MRFLILAGGWVLVSSGSVLPGEQAQAMAGGTVFNDRDGDGRRDPGEEGVPGIRVSNQRQIVLSDRSGRWRLPFSEDTIFFVIKPRGWATRLDRDKLPRFYYVHKPGGSPTSKYGGVAPTGPLPNSIDFPLRPRKEPERFRVVFFSDTQPRDEREVDYLGRDVVEELIGIDAAFGVTLGDIVFDDLSLYKPLNETVGLIGLPWHNVMGNHDMNYDAADDKYSDETFERVYGPPYYSFDYARVHFVVLDDIKWIPPQGTAQGRYVGGLGSAQLEWLNNDLALTPRGQLVVLLTHIPLASVEDRLELYRLIEGRPFALTVSGHTHSQEHRFIAKADGWQGARPHHNAVNVAASGSWWQGAPDEFGIPQSPMRDGAPNGYSIYTFDGQKYSIEFRAARRSPDYQMAIYAPESVAASQANATPVYANVFAGSARSIVEMRLGENGAWLPMRKVERPDPEYSIAYERDKSLKLPYRPLPPPMISPHLWESNLPEKPPTGAQVLYVRTTDMFGRTYMANRIIRIR